MKKNLLFTTLFFLVSCSVDSPPSLSSNSTTFDYRDYAMGSFRVGISHNYRFINPNISNFTADNELNLTVFRSTYYDDELIIKGVHGECIFAYMKDNKFSFSPFETNLRPENLGFNISPHCPSCKIYMSGSGSVSELERGIEKSTFSITIKLNYDGVDLVDYNGSKQLNLPRPVTEADDC